MADENMYDDGPAMQPPPAGKGSDAGKADGEMSDKGGQTYLLPKEVLMGKHFEVGDEVVLKITGMHDDSIQVEYAPEKGKGEEGEEEYEGDKEAEAPPEEQQQAAPPGAGNTPQGDMAGMMY
jgi:hypothetical protein